MDFNFTKNIEDTVETEGKVNCEGSVFFLFLFSLEGPIITEK
jgi:hypothetical protein